MYGGDGMIRGASGREEGLSPSKSHRLLARPGAIAIAFTLSSAGMAAAQSIGAGQTVTNNSPATNQFYFVGDNATLINNSSIATSNVEAVLAAPFVFESTNVDDFAFNNLSIINSGTISRTNNVEIDGSAITIVAVNGLTLNNAGTITADNIGFGNPVIYFYNVNNVSFTNNGQIIGGDNTGGLDLFRVMNSTFVNNNLISSMSAFDPAVFIAGDTANVIFSNSGTISSTCLFCSTFLVGGFGAFGNMISGFLSVPVDDIVTNLTINNAGTISATTGTAVEISGESSAVTLNNSGTISRSDPGGDFFGNAVLVSGLATDVTINNSGMITADGSSATLSIGGIATGVTLNNAAGGTIAATGTNPAVEVTSSASGVSINNAGLISALSGTAVAIAGSSDTTLSNSGTIRGGGAGPAISVTTERVLTELTFNSFSINNFSASSATSIDNTGTIAANGGVGMGGVAISNETNTQPLHISNSGTISGDIVFSQPGDTLTVTGGSILGAVTTTTAGNGSVNFDLPGQFTTNGDIGSPSSPLGSISVSGGTVMLGNSWFANAVNFGPGSTTLLTGNVNMVAAGGSLNLSGGTLALGTNTLTLGANATVRTTGTDGSILQTTIGTQANGQINAGSGATVDTSGNTLIITPRLAGQRVSSGDQYAIIRTSDTSNIANALAKVSVDSSQTPGIRWTATTAQSIDGYGNQLLEGKDIVLLADVPTLSPAVNQAIMSAQVRAFSTVLTTRIQSFVFDLALQRIGGRRQPFSAVRTGLSAGSPYEDTNWAVWADGSGSYLRNDSSLGGFEGYSVVALSGIDYSLDQTWLFGFSAGHVRSDVGVKSVNGNRTSTGVVVGPYLAYILNEHFSADGLFNFTRLDNTATNTNDFVTHRYTGAVNFNAFYNIEDFALTGYVGYLYAAENPTTPSLRTVLDRPSAVHYGAIKIGGEMAYPMGDFEPYLPLTVEYETTQPRDGVGRTGLRLGLGSRYRVSDALKADFLLTGELARSNSADVTASFNLRLAF
jgi:hypothetical protein